MLTATYNIKINEFGKKKVEVPRKRSQVQHDQEITQKVSSILVHAFHSDKPARHSYP